MIKGLERKPTETEEQYDARIEDIVERIDEFFGMIENEYYYCGDWKELLQSPEDQTREWKEFLRDALNECNVNVRYWIGMRCQLADLIARLDEMNVPTCIVGDL